MPEPAPAPAPAAVADGNRRALSRFAHLTFFLVLGAGLVRLVRLNSPLCWEMAAVSGLLALTYAGGLAGGFAGGLAGGERLGRRGRAVWVAALVLLWSGLLLLAPDPLATAYVWGAVPLACAALRALDRRAAGAAVAAITAILVGRLVHSAGAFDAEVVLIPVAAVWGTVALYRAQQRDAVERQRLVEELRGTRDVLARQQREAGVLAERARIARDLHDTLAQELAGGVMLLQAAERDWDGRPERARTRVRAAADGLAANLTETRRIIRDLTPGAVDEAGLEGALRLLCARAQAEGAAAQVGFRSTGAPEPAPDTQAAAALFRVAQGALANVREHARAANVLVTLERRADRVELEVRDDGVGIGRHPTARPTRGLGLPAARARLRECGGDLDVHSTQGRGTRVRAVVPVRPEPSRGAHTRAEPQRPAPARAAPPSAVPTQADTQRVVSTQPPDPQRAVAAQADPQRAVLTQPEPPSAMPTQAEPQQAVPTRPEPDRAVHTQAEPQRAMPAQPEQRQATPARPQPDRAVHTQAERRSAMPTELEPPSAMPTQAEPPQATPARPQPTRAAHPQAEPQQAQPRPQRAVPAQAEPQSAVPAHADRGRQARSVQADPDRAAVGRGGPQAEVRWDEPKLMAMPPTAPHRTARAQAGPDRAVPTPTPASSDPVTGTQARPDRAVSGQDQPGQVGAASAVGAR